MKRGWIGTKMPLTFPAGVPPVLLPSWVRGFSIPPQAVGNKAMPRSRLYTKPYVRALYVCLICMPPQAVGNKAMPRSRLYTMPYVRALYVCLICMPPKADGNKAMPRSRLYNLAVTASLTSWRL